MRWRTSPAASIAVAMHALNGDRARATAWAEVAHARNPAITQEDFFRSFPFASPDVKQHIARALAAFGI